MTPILALRDVTVERVGRRVLEAESLAIEEGAHVAVVGPNGAGKSTLLRVLGLLERPAGGTVLVRGRPAPARPREALRLRRRIAMVLQAPPLCDTTVRANVALGLGFRGIRGREADRRIRPWLARLGIEHLAERRARALSGGEEQRVALARAFVLEPEVLLLDEPFAALDAPSRDSLLGDLEAILRELRTTVVTVTHDPDEAARLADDLVVLVGGRIRAAGPKRDLLRHPPNRETAELFGFTVLACGGRRVAVPPGGLALGDGPVTFAMRVERVVDLGYGRRVIGRVGESRLAVDVPNGDEVPAAGDRVSVAAAGAVELPAG